MDPRRGRGDAAIRRRATANPQRYDATPLVLGAVDAAAGIVDLRPWLADIGALDSGGAPTDKLRHGSTFVTTMIVTKLFVPVKLPLAAALTPRVARLMARWRGGPKAR